MHDEWLLAIAYLRQFIFTLLSNAFPCPAILMLYYPPLPSAPLPLPLPFSSPLLLLTPLSTESLSVQILLPHVQILYRPFSRKMRLSLKGFTLLNHGLSSCIRIAAQVLALPEGRLRTLQMAERTVGRAAKQSFSKFQKDRR